MPFFLQGFLSVISQTESLVLTSHRPILFPFCVWMLPCRSISCPETLKSEQRCRMQVKMCYSNTVFVVWFRKKFPHWKEELYHSCPRELKRQKFLPYEWACPNCQSHLLALVCGSSPTAPKASCTVCSLKTLPIATVIISQLYFKIRLSMLWST